jgi:hypothetical protein
MKCPNPMTPLGISAPKSLKVGHVGRVRVVAYNAKGKATPARGATVFVNGKSKGRTDKQGVIDIKGKSRGLAQIYATQKVRARSQQVDVRIK